MLRVSPETDESSTTHFICAICGQKSLRSQRKIDEDSGERLYEDVHCAECQRTEERKITYEELAGLPTSGRIQ